MANKKGRPSRNNDGFMKSSQVRVPGSRRRSSSLFPSFTNRRNVPPARSPYQANLGNTGSSLLNTTLPNPNIGSSTRPRQTNVEPPKHKKHSRKKIVLRSLLVVVLLLVGMGIWLGWGVIGNIDKVFHGNIFSDIEAFIHPTELKGEAGGRINILLAGDSADDPGHQGADLTDSIMIVSLNTKNHTGFMLSIPRDTWVNIPGMGYSKINAANDMTSFSAPGYPNGGMGQLGQIVTTDFGIPIDYYALIDYTAFRDAVDAVGTITINIQSPDPRGLYDPNTHIDLPNGEVTLDGQEALNLARARGDGPGAYGFPQADYDRTEHQRQMLVALEQKASTAGVLTNPIKISDLFNALGNNVHTDLTLADVLALSKLTKGINTSKLQSVTFSESGTNPLLQNYLAPDGEDALIPTDGIGNYTQIQEYYQQLTATSTN